MKYIKFLILGILLGSLVMAYPIYSFHTEDIMANIEIPVIDTEEGYVREYSFYEGEHYRLTREEILYYFKNTEFTQGNPIEPIKIEDELPDEIHERIPEEITAFLKDMRLPVEEEYFQISSNYGLRTDPITEEKNTPHWGIDIAAPGIEGSPVYAVLDGVVEYAAERGSFGNLVILSHNSGKVKTYYAHLGTIEDIVPGDQVKKGEKLGTVGSTGKSTGPHLHFEVHIPVDPILFIGRS